MKAVMNIDDEETIASGTDSFVGQNLNFDKRVTFIRRAQA
jgi:hypothetical protein